MAGSIEIKPDLLLKAMGVLVLILLGMAGWYLEDLSDRIVSLEQTIRGLVRAVEIGAGGE